MKVFVLVIDHRHGRNVSVYDTEVAANIAVENYCREWWEMEVGGKQPKDAGQLISRYFEKAEEFWEVDEHDIQTEATASTPEGAGQTIITSS